MVEVREVGQVLGLGLVATAPVAAGATIIEEEPLWTVSIEKIFNDHAFLQRKDVQAIVAAVAAGDAAPERANALMRLYAGHALSRLDDDVKAKVWRLADSIRDAQSGDRCLVSVGVEEDAVAGRFGDVVDVSDDGDERAICKVRIGDEEHAFPRWRLKTARGLWRTNAVEHGGVGYVYERLSRVNHACGRGANCERVFSDDGRCALIATTTYNAVFARARDFALFHRPADVVVGCIGFERNTTFCEQLTGRDAIMHSNYLDKNMIYLADAEIDESAFNSFFGSSVLEYAKFYTNVFVEGLERPDAQPRRRAQQAGRAVRDGLLCRHHDRCRVSTPILLAAVRRIARRGAVMARYCLNCSATGCCLGDLGWHGEWVVNNELDEVRAKLLTIN